MQSSRTERILREWDSAAQSAIRPPTPSPREMSRTSIPAVALSSVAVGLLIVGVVLLVISRPNLTGIVGTSPSPSGTASPAPSSSPSATESPTATASPLVIGPAQPGDAVTAASLVSRYIEALIHGQWRAAWDLLSPEQQTHWGSYNAYETDRSAFFKSVNGRYTAATPTHDAATIERWVVPDNYPAAPISPATPDYDRAFLVEVDYPALAGNNAGWEELLAAPSASGTWYIWQVR